MPDFLADCAKCAALCCVAPSFSKSDDFAFDKPAHTACPHLRRDHRCDIHAELVGRGFRGCAHYDCSGAGPRVTAMFAASSRDDPAVASTMLAVFLVVRVLHEELLLLETARRVQLDGDLDGALGRELGRMRDELERAGQGTVDELVCVDAFGLRKRNRALLSRIGRAIGGKARLFILD